MYVTRIALATFGFVALRAPVARASSDAAYTAFRADVAKRCTVRAKSEFADPIVIVDAFGTESYGIALVYGRPQTPKGTTQLPGLASKVCVYDKKTRKIELSGDIQTNFAAH